jgi:hypothetical protein
MIDTLYSIYKFVTDVPTMIDVFSVILPFIIAGQAATMVEPFTKNKVMMWLVGILVFCACLGVLYFMHRVVGLPHWVGWIV